MFYRFPSAISPYTQPTTSAPPIQTAKKPQHQTALRFFNKFSDFGAFPSTKLLPGKSLTQLGAKSSLVMEALQLIRVKFCFAIGRIDNVRDRFIAQKATDAQKRSANEQGQLAATQHLRRPAL